MAHLNLVFEADILNVGAHSSTRLLTSCMKNLLDRLGNSQLTYELDGDRFGTKRFYVLGGQKATLVVQGYANLF